MEKRKENQVLEKILKDRGEVQQVSMTFEEFLRDVFFSNPKKYSRGAHRYLVDAIESYGTDEKGNLKFFEGKIFGADHQVRELYELLKSAAMGNDVKRRIILLVGPVGTAKSTTVYHLKRLLEEYSRTEEGEIYAIEGCPLNEDPLHLLSESARQELRKEYGIHIEGQLCPVCSYRLREDYQGDISKVRVKRIFLSESDRVGIATFAPGDPNTQDLSDIVGSINIYTIQREGKGDPAHPLSWSFTGAAFQSNRGIFEFIELFKAKRELLNALLTLAQERQVKPGRFNMIYVDTVILAHTNYTEYNRFISEPGTEAIRDRTRVVEWKYVLNPYEEEKVYRLMIPNIAEYDMDPWSLKYPAFLAVLSRLSDPEDREFPAQVRLKIYSGEKVDGLSEYAISTVYKKFEADGRSGLSPRWVVDQINLIQVKKGYVATPDLITHFSDLLPKVLGEKQASIIRPLAVSKYNEYVKSLLSEVVVSDFESLAQSYFDRYRAMVRSFRANEKVYVPSTGEWREPDEEFMRSLESLIGINSPSEASVFRTNFLVAIGEIAERGEKISWRSHKKIEEAIRAMIIKEHKSLLRAALVSRGISEEADRTYEKIVQRLIKDHGYSENTAKRLLEYAGELVNYT
jgi:serine protein kinase